MKLKTMLVAGAALTSFFGQAAMAQTAAYSGVGAVSGGVPGTLNIGRTFTVSGPGIYVKDLGVFAVNGQALVNSHTVSLFSNATGAPTFLTSTTIGAGQGLLIDDFRYQALNQALYLAAGNYSVIAYGLSSGGDPYGDGGVRASGTLVNDGGFDPYQFTTNASPAYPAGGDGVNHSSASFLYSAVPEPATWAMMLLGFGMIGVGMRYRRKGTKVAFG